MSASNMSAPSPKNPEGRPLATRRPPEQKPETAPGVFASVDTKKWRWLAIGALVALLAGGAVAVWRGVEQGQNAERWARLATITDAHDDMMNDLGSNSGSLVDSIARDGHIKELEAFIAKEPADAPATIHAHSMVANLQMAQIVAATSATKSTDLSARYDSAAAHWKRVKESGMELPLTANRFRPQAAARAVDLMLQKLEINRKWDAAHGFRDAETNPDVVVLLRTTEGDLRVRLYSKPDQSPLLARAFADHAARGDFDGTLLFEKRADSDEGWVRGGDARVRKTEAEPTDADRLGWDVASTGDPILPEPSRHRIVHAAGTVSAWHQADDPYDDPSQFLLVTKASPQLDAKYTPFGKIDDASLPALDRLAAAKTRADEKPEIRMDAKLSKLADQIAKPPVIVRALVYDMGVLRAGRDAVKLDPTEAKLETVVPDATRVLPPPPPPVPAAAPATPPATPPAAPADPTAPNDPKSPPTPAADPK